MKIKIAITIIVSMLLSIVGGGLLSSVYGLSPVPVIGGLMTLSLIPNIQPSGSLLAGLYREVWTKDVIRLIDEGLKDTFLDGIPDLSRYVTGDEEHQTIHATYFNSYPDVLVDNTNYPIDLQTLEGADKTISLNKYQTKVTPITDDELYALTYDKKAEVKISHAQAIALERLKRSAFNFAPSGKTTKTPVLKTTGANSSDGTRKRLIWDDIVRLRESLQGAKIPIEDCRLVLNYEHVNDLLLEDKDLFNVLANFKQGLIVPQLGFDIRTYNGGIWYLVSGLTKMAYGATPNLSSGNANTWHRMASFVFSPTLARKAKGKTFTYFAEAKTDPQYQRNLFSVRDYFIAKPILEDTHIAAIVSDVPA